LLSSDLFTVTITENETGETVQFSDGWPAASANDSNSAQGTINLIPASVENAFKDFKISAFQSKSNRVFDIPNLYATLTQSGTITRTTTTPGTRSLTITVTDSGYGHPVLPKLLSSTASATFTNYTPDDSVTFQSFANGSASPLISLIPTKGTNPDSESGNAAPTPFLDLPPLTLTNVFVITLGPSTGTKTVKFQDTGSSTITGDEPSSLSGNVYHDADLSGDLNSGDVPLGGVPITLSGTNYLGQSITQQTTTAADGSYSFPALRAGTYQVVETQPVGYNQGTDTVGSAGGSRAVQDILSAVVLGAGIAATDYNFGEILPGSLSGFVYVDANNDGIKQGGETPISGVSLTLLDASGNTIATTTTATDGSYSFENLAPGSYSVVETQPTGYYDGQDALNGTVQPGSIGTDGLSSISVTQGNNAPNNNFGELLPVTIGDFVWNDADADGVQDIGELGIGGVTLILTGTNYAGAAVTDSATTDGNGHYHFIEAPGTYSVSVDTTSAALAGYTATLPGQGTTDADSNSSGTTTPATLPSGASDLSIDFGYYLPQLGEIHGTKYLDITGNGFSADDTPFGGVTITLIDSTGHSTTTTTADDGSYSFTGLSAGTYKVREVVPDGYVQTGPTSLVPNVTISGGAATYSVVVNAGQSLSGFDFDNTETCDLSDFTNIYYTVSSDCGTTHPKNLRGNTDQGDTVTVRFKYTGTERNHPVTLVSYVAPGSSFVASQAALQKIFQQSTVLANPGETYTLTVTLPNCDYQVDFVCGYAIDTFGPAGSNIFYTPQDRLISADNDGCQVLDTSTISGTVFTDKNSDCGPNGGSAGIAGVTITLTGVDFMGNPVSQTTTTDTNGKYSFTGLQASDKNGYTITESTVAGYVHKGQSAGSTGGTTGDHTITTFLNTNTRSTSNNFCETTPAPACDKLVSGDTATIGFWQNKNGQALIGKMNGSSSSKALGNWLASSFPNLYGPAAGSSNNLTGKTNSQVADYFTSLFKVKGQKTYAQVLANALAVYVTNSTLAGGNYAAAYGFNVSTHGTGTSTYNVGSDYAAFGVAKNTTMTVFQVLQAVNNQTCRGVINKGVFNTINDVASDINETGDI
jgi:hypothetical protein